MTSEKNRLYTGAGDEGYTQLLGPERIPKYDLRPDAYGTIDEAGSFMGLARAETPAGSRTHHLILQAQRDLWILMGELAASPGVTLPRQISAEHTARLEAELDRLSAETPPLTQFVIPGDTRIGALLDVARTVIRRGERLTAALAHSGQLKNAEILRYLNRLSSLLFALARYEEQQAGQKPTLVKDIK